MNKDILQERRLTFSVFLTVAMRVILQRRKRWKSHTNLTHPVKVF